MSKNTIATITCWVFAVTFLFFDPPQSTPFVAAIFVLYGLEKNNSLVGVGFACCANYPLDDKQQATELDRR